MRALTLTQPWAGLVASGIKPEENRPRKMIKLVNFGEPFAIHASREIDSDVYVRIREMAPELFRGPGNSEIRTEEPWYRLSRITSAVIAVATVEDMHDLDTAAGQRWLAALPPERARFVFGPIVYSLKDIRALATPVPCSGKQGFWTLPEVEEVPAPGEARRWRSAEEKVALDAEMASRGWREFGAVAGSTGSLYAPVEATLDRRGRLTVTRKVRQLVEEQLA